MPVGGVGGQLLAESPQPLGFQADEGEAGAAVGQAAGEEFELPEVAAEKPKIVDLMAALEASVEAAKSARTRHPAAKPKAKKSA